jgi:hypothetical protein
MQAFFLYILIRLDEGENEHNNVDTLLVQTIIVSFLPHCITPNILALLKPHGL